jgi:hypothetical protein
MLVANPDIYTPLRDYWNTLLCWCDACSKFIMYNDCEKCNIKDLIKKAKEILEKNDKS